MKAQINNILKSTPAKVDEVFLFMEMLKYLNTSMATHCFVKSMHAHAGFVDYDSSITGNREKIEIADLLIINHNKPRRETRICFVQAKFKKNNYRKFVSFHGDLYQWELLSNRLNVIDTYNNGFPTNILNFTGYKTITSYGLFYKDRNGEIDFLYTLPDHLRPTGKTKKTTLNFPGRCICPNSLCTAGHMKDETISICSMDGFEKELCKGKIGAPISKGLTPYIHSLLRSMYASTNNPFIQQFIQLSEFAEVTSKEGLPYINTALIISNEQTD